MIIPTMGIEIRKVGDLDSLYREVDLVLSQNDLTGEFVSIEVKSATIAHSLQKMLKPGGWFDVTTIKHCAQMVGKYISGDRLDLYQASHCISWSEMLPEFRQILVAMVLDDFRTVLKER